jgi:HAD superfamily hydrolase (TIGR01549 family)
MPLACELRSMVADFSLTGLLTQDEWTVKDPHVVLRAIHRARWQADLEDFGAKDEDLAALVELLEKAVTAGEVAAARIAWPTPDADALIRRLAAGGLRLAVVTNNSPLSADTYLRNHGLRQYFEVIHGRTADPDLMKPHPYVLLQALHSLDLQPEAAVMIGDTPTDAEAAEAANVPFIGYGRNMLKRARLREAGAKVVLEAYRPLLNEAAARGTQGSGARFVGETVHR